MEVSPLENDAESIFSGLSVVPAVLCDKGICRKSLTGKSLLEVENKENPMGLAGHLLLLIVALAVLLPWSFGQGGEPSLEETMTFLKSKIEGSRADGVVQAHGNDGCTTNIIKSFVYDSFKVDKCSIDIKELVSWSWHGSCSFTNPPRGETNTLSFSLSNLAIASSKVDEYPMTGIITGGEYKQPIFRVVLSFLNPLTTTHPDGTSSIDHEWSVVIQDKAMAERLLRAFSRGGQLCGAKKEPF